MRNQLLALASSILLTLPGCLTPGERAGSGSCLFSDCTFSCPEGEVCSAATPSGLYFMGKPLFDDNGPEGPRPTASGGTQTVTVLGSDSSSDPFSLPYGTEALSPLSVDSSFDSEVTVRCDGVGSGYLRIFDPDTGELYDRVSLECASVSGSSSVPYEMAFLSPEAAASGNWLLYEGGTSPIGIRLTGAGSRLVDESISFTISGDAMDDGDATTWDARRAYVGTFGSATISVTTGSGDLLEWNWPVVNLIDDIVRAPSIEDPNTTSTLTVGKTVLLCFQALREKKPIAGVPWSATPMGAMVAEPAKEGCFHIKATAAGTAILQVKADYQQTDFTFSMVKSARAIPNEAIDAPRSSHLRGGERTIGARP